MGEISCSETSTQENIGHGVTIGRSNNVWSPPTGERYFMSLKEPAVGLEHCAMSDEQDECPESYKQSHSL